MNNKKTVLAIILAVTGACHAAAEKRENPVNTVLNIRELGQRTRQQLVFLSAIAAAREMRKTWELGVVQGRVMPVPSKHNVHLFLRYLAQISVFLEDIQTDSWVYRIVNMYFGNSLFADTYDRTNGTYAMTVNPREAGYSISALEAMALGIPAILPAVPNQQADAQAAHAPTTFHREDLFIWCYDTQSQQADAKHDSSRTQ